MFVTFSVGVLIKMRANFTTHFALTFIYFCSPVRVGKPVSLVAV